MRMLFDVTRLLQSGLHTGIQRVLRSLLAGCDAAGLPALAVSFDGAQWLAHPRLAPHPLQGLAPQPALPPHPIAPGPGDALLMFDASWYLDPWPAVDAALARGARLAAMVHDLLPLQQPQWFRPQLQPLFTHHLACMAERAHAWFVPSATVARGLAQHLGGAGAAPCPRIQVLPHGGDFLLCNGPARPPALPRPKALPATPYHLVVSTLEPRKQHGRILDAFERLWQRGFPASLVFIGALGWKIDALQERLRQHPQRGQKLHHLENLSDPELAYCYTHAQSLIYLSRDEGFGLPVLEAAMLGCPVIASDIPVLRETGQNWPVYLDPASTTALEHALQTWPPQSPPGAAPQRRWEDVARQLHAALLPLSDATRPTATAAPATSAPLADLPLS